MGISWPCDAALIAARSVGYMGDNPGLVGYVKPYLSAFFGVT